MDTIMKDFLKLLVSQLVNAPEDVSINEVLGQNTVILEITCRKDDVGKVIGKGGQTISAIRQIMIAMASKSQLRVTLEIVE